ncbi:MAG: CvpA family protein [Dissulfurimicrobium sp.]|uniref:CvpA family protein n=1 Tax=Dissulfurimicrobium TaxID=1769732 RepID=UPI003C78D098
MWFNTANIHFNILDFIITIIIAITVLRGFFVGFSRSAASLLGILLGFWVGMTHFSILSDRLTPFIKEEIFRSLIAFFLLFILVYMAFIIIGIIIKGLLKTLHLSLVDRIMGGLIGLAKGLILTGVIIFLLTVFLPARSPLLADSLLYPRLSQISQALCALVPDHIKGRFMWKWKQIHHDATEAGIEV